MAFRVRLLGPVEAEVDGMTVELGGPRQRRLLGVLALTPNALVDTTSVVDAVWADGDYPADPRETLRSYVSRLRSTLGGSATVLGRGGGYRLVVDPGDVDASGFAELAAMDDIASLTAALRLWPTGVVLAGFEHEEWARPSAARLIELRARTADELGDRLIAAERFADAVVELEGAAALAPLRERTHRLLMLALHGGGRQAESLRVYQAFRNRLATDLGLEPSSDLRALEATIAVGSAGARLLPPSPVTASEHLPLRCYTVLELIGEGAYAAVYRGLQPSVRREVAIKRIHARLANRAEFIRRFEAEAHLVARLEHPHIGPLYDYWREPDSACLVMRWMRGGSLAQTIASRPQPLPWAIAMAREVGSALAFAHEAGVVHRDIKPENVLLDEEGHAYLADFGVALSVSAAEMDPRSSVGSPAYAAPEQLSGVAVEPSADVYALAAVLFEVLTGVVPTRLARVRDYRSDVPTAVDSVIAAALAQQPSSRFSTINAFVAALTEAATRGEGGPVKAAAAERIAQPAGTPPSITRNPYKGLLAFDEADAADFHGRERLVDDLLERLAAESPHSRLLALVGPSGSGKSSVINAGLLPALRDDGVAGSSRWYVTTMVPGTAPFEELERALLRVASSPHLQLREQLEAGPSGVLDGVRRVLGEQPAALLLVIDQFEELFTHVEDQGERTRFLDRLTHALTSEESPLRVVLTLRADFYDRPLRHPAFAALMSRSTVTITPLAADELERAITAPAERIGFEFEPGLVARVLTDVASEPGALPLLQYALAELFDHRSGRVLTNAAYEHLGGLTGALHSRADALYADAEPDRQHAIRRMFLRLVTFGEGSEDTRRRVRRSELSDDEHTTQAIASYGTARLLSFDHDPATREPTVEVAHEALIRRWPQLREWLDEDRAALRIHRHLTTAALAWANAGCDAGELYRGARLHAAEEWQARQPSELNELERDFLEASLAARRAEQEAEERHLRQQVQQNRRLRRLLVLVAGVAALAIIAGGLALQQQTRARHAAEVATLAATEAETRRLISDAAQLVSTNRRVALLLAAEAHRREPSVGSLGALQRVLVGMGDVLGYLGNGGRYDAVTWLGDSRLLGARDEAIDLFDERGGLQRSIALRSARVLAVSPDQRWLAVGFEGGAAIVDLEDPSFEPRRLDVRSSVQALAFSPDSARLAIGERNGDVLMVETTSSALVTSWSAHPEHTVAELGLSGAVSEVVPHVPASAVRGVAALAFATDGAVLASTGWGSVRTWDPSAGRRLSSTALTKSSGGIVSVSVGAAVGFADVGGSRRLLAVDRESVRIIDPTDGGEVALHPLANRASTASMDFVDKPVELRGSLVVSVFRGGLVESTDVDGGPGATTESGFDTHLPEISDLALSFDGDRIAASGPDGIALIARDGDRTLARTVGTSPVGELAITDDGAIGMRSASTPFDWNLWRLGVDAQGGTDSAPIAVPSVEYMSQAFSDRYVVAFTRPRRIEVFDVRSERMVATVPWEHDGGVPQAWLTADERQLILSSLDGYIDVFSWPEPTLLRRFDRPDLGAHDGSTFFSGSLHPDGRRFLGVSGNGAAFEWSLDTGEVKVLSPAGGDIAQAKYSHDGTLLATVRDDGSVVMRDALTLQPRSAPFVGNTASSVVNLGPWFSEDDRYLITTSDGAARLWDVASGRQIGGAFPSDPAWNASASTNGRWLVGGSAGRILRWELDPASWPRLACEAAGRNLTADEWRQIGPAAEPVQPSCPQYDTTRKHLEQ
ncbi:MAG: protein kinase [Acidimicrobiales bacterium]|nr:protein kinase [Acidimicrobiales bacterium]